MRPSGRVRRWSVTSLPSARTGSSIVIAQGDWTGGPVSRRRSFRSRWTRRAAHRIGSGGLDPPHGLVEATGPWLTVAGQGQAGVEPAQSIERHKRLGGIGTERRDHRSRRAVGDGDRRERVADEHDRPRLDHERRAARRVTGHEDDPRRARRRRAWRRRRTSRPRRGSSCGARPCGCRAAGTAASGAAGSGRRPWPGWAPRRARAPHRARGPTPGSPAPCAPARQSRCGPNGRGSAPALGRRRGSARWRSAPQGGPSTGPAGRRRRS